jgi:hypothetical protein
MRLWFLKPNDGGSDVAPEPHSSPKAEVSDAQGLPVALPLHQPTGWGSAASLMSPDHIPDSLRPKGDARKTEVFDDELE